MNKTQVAKMAVSCITFESVNTIVDPAVKSIVPSGGRLHKRVFAKMGGYMISAAITHAITKEIDEIIDTVVQTKEMCDEIKREAFEAAKMANTEGE